MGRPRQPITAIATMANVRDFNSHAVDFYDRMVPVDEAMRLIKVNPTALRSAMNEALTRDEFVIRAGEASIRFCLSQNHFYLFGEDLRSLIK